MKASGNIIALSFKENLIEKIAGIIYEDYYKKDKDLSRVACVFGGRRPALFLRRALSRRIKKSFIPPQMFSMDEFMEYVLCLDANLPRISELDALYLIYTLARKSSPGILMGRENFNEFLPWAHEIISFIEQLDLEKIDDESLFKVEKSAEIGYDISENINLVLQYMVKIRNGYHLMLKQKGLYSRGLMYLTAANKINIKDLDKFEKIFFCSFYYLHATEADVIKKLYQAGRAVCVFQGDQDDWSVLRENAKSLKTTIKAPLEEIKDCNVNLYQGFDVHSQVSLVREIIKKIDNQENTVIVLPDSSPVVPLLSEVSSYLKEYNISMGYSLKHSPLYELFDLLLKAQESRKGYKYYSRDYLNLLRHPLIKNLKLGDNFDITRVLVHKLEELIKGGEQSSIGGSLFLSLDEIENEEKICILTQETLSSVNEKVTFDDCLMILKELHLYLFKAWEDFSTFTEFAEKLGEFLDLLVDKSMLGKFPYNIKIIEKLYALADELQNVSFSKKKFNESQIRDIFRKKIDREMISFVGSPLRGTQILGLLETRSLNFDNVIIMDMNESLLPKLKIYEPLIPREVMLSLGLNRLEKEEEIQHYQFMRLIRAAKNVHLVYEQSDSKEKSRFIEELLWNKQKQMQRLEVMSIPKARFNMQSKITKRNVKKTDQILNFLKNSTYSASRLNVYLNCPLRFYYQYVLALKQKEDLLQHPEGSGIGTFIHELLKETFGCFINQKPIIDASFKKLFLKSMREKFKNEIARRMKSDSFLLKGIIEARLMKFLEREEERDIVKIISLEDKREAIFKLDNEDIKFSYTIDRIDEYKDGSLLIIDYKTGGANISPKRIAQLQSMQMNRSSIKENVRSFQLPLYYYFLKEQHKSRSLNAALYNLRMLELTYFVSSEDTDISEKVALCMQAVGCILKEIFDPGIDFEADDSNVRYCDICPYFLLCR